MISQLILGALVLVPALCWRPPLSFKGLLCCITVAVIVALCMPKHWHDGE
jgi:hypothetical protein